MSELIMYIIAILLAVLLLFAMVYFIVELSDLQDDYINPIDLCNKLDKLVIPEMATHAALVLLFAINLELTPVLVNLPLAGYHGYLLANNTWHYDPTTIFRDLSGRRRVCFIKAGFYVLSFFYYIVTLIITSVAYKA